MPARYGRARIVSGRRRLQRDSLKLRAAFKMARPAGANAPFAVSFTGLPLASSARPAEVSSILSFAVPLALVVSLPEAMRSGSCLGFAAEPWAPFGMRSQETESRPAA